MKKYIAGAVVIGAALFLISCTAGHSKHMRPDAGYISEPKATAPSKEHTGSLWQEQDCKSLLFADRKACKVNDIVTVAIVESAAAKGSSSTTTDKSSAYSGEVSSLFGLPSSMGMSNFLGSGQPFQPKVAADTKNSFSGTGDTQRTGILSATITAKVIQVYPNGTLKISGGREVTINNETQYIILTGIIRREDISHDNIIRSDFIADARIEYYGEGTLADKDSPGWLSRGLDWVWPF